MSQDKFPQLETLEARQLFSTSTSSIQVLPTLGDKAQYTSVAVNPLTQQPAVAYYDTTHHQLNFLQFTHNHWIAATVDSNGDVGTSASLKFDQSGNPWIAYYDATNGDLKIAHESKRTWHIQTVDSSYSQGRYLSLALTKAGLPVIAYYGSTSAAGAGLKLATLTSQGWKYDTIASDPDAADDGAPGEYCSLALDGHDRPRIAFADHDANLDYASLSGHTWSIHTLESNGQLDGDSVFGTDLVLDSAGEPHIAYTLSSSMDGGGVFYAVESKKGWNFQEVDSQAIPGTGEGDSSSIGLVLSAKGQPTIAYQVYNGFANVFPANDQLAIAVPTTKAGGATFTDTIIDASKRVGGYVSTAQNSSGDTLVAYVDLNGVLKLYQSK